MLAMEEPSRWEETRHVHILMRMGTVKEPENHLEKIAFSILK